MRFALHRTTDYDRPMTRSRESSSKISVSVPTVLLNGVQSCYPNMSRSAIVTLALRLAYDYASASRDYDPSEVMPDPIHWRA